MIWPVRVAGMMTLTCLVTAAAIPVALAGPLSDTFQPDVFGTAGALRQRTPGLTDPLGLDCALPTTALSVSAAVDLALCRNPATRSAWAVAHRQAAALGAAESAWLPNVSVTGSETRDVGDHIDVTGNLARGTQDTRDAAAALSWTLYDFGARGGRITSARRLLDASSANAGSVVQQTVLNVVQGYYGVVAGDALLEAARATETAYGKSLDVARALHDGGVTTRADVLQAETAYDQAVIGRVQAERNAHSAHGALAIVVGYTAEQPLKLASEPVPAIVPELTARIDDLMDEAARQRPDLKAAQAQRDSAEADIGVARALGRPSISISAAREFSDVTGLPNQNYTVIGVNVTVPIFAGFNVGYGVRQAQATFQQREADAEQVRLQVSLDVWNGYYALDAANQQLATTATLLKAAQENQEVALGRYQSGVGSILDLLTAQSSASNARQQRINAELNWQVARAQLALALGRLSGAEPLATGSALP